jgi:hypothetical protein
MHGVNARGSEPRRKWKLLSPFRFAAAVIIGTVAVVVMVVALVTVVFWLVLGSLVWLVGAAAGVAKPQGGRRLRSTGMHLLRSGPSRWLVLAALHRVRRAWSGRGSSSEA